MKNPAPLLPRPLPPHPRLLAGGEDWPRLKNQIQTDPPSARIFASLEKKAAELLLVPPVERIMNGYRLLYESRKALERITTLAMVFRIGGDPRFARRALAELDSVCRFSDWNPSHYLDVAEMALAVAVGYDWLHDQLGEEEKSLIARALREKGIQPSLQEPKQWFITGNNNWNQVCHAGMAAAAIALAGREPDLSEQVLRRSIDNLHYAAGAYAPDGAYPEGPMYWNYGTGFHVVLAAALERLTGSTQGTDAYPGFAASADYVAQMTTPTGHFYNYADCRRTRHMLIPLFWFARRFQRPDWLAPDLKKLGYHLDLYDQNLYDDSNYRLLALALLWRDPSLVAAPGASPSRHWLGRGPMPVAAFRSAFDDTNALYAAIKGGSPSLNHAHMDVGSFMIEADGVAWATDLGMHPYETLEAAGLNLWDASENGTRWTILRLGAEGHNILRFNNGRQLLKGSAHFTRFCGEGSHPHAVLDLSPLYTGQALAVRRGLMLLENRAVLIQDEWTAGDQPAEIAWQMLTPAAVSIRDGEVHLEHEGKKCVLKLLGSLQTGIRVEEAFTLQHPAEDPNPGIRRITVKTGSGAGQQGTLRILLEPGPDGAAGIPPLRKLEDWSGPLS